MRRSTLVFSLFLTTSIVAGGTASIAETSKKLPIAPVALAKTFKNISQSLSQPRRRPHRPLSTHARVTKNFDADLVTVQLSYQMIGTSAADTIKKLSAKRKALVAAAAQKAVKVLKTDISSLSVHTSRHARNGQLPQYTGSLAIKVTIEAGEDVLASVALLADPSVIRISSLQYAFSDERWAQVTSQLKKMLLTQAKEKAQNMARQRGTELGQAVPGNLNMPRRSSRVRQKIVPLRASGRFQFYWKK